MTHERSETNGGAHVQGGEQTVTPPAPATSKALHDEVNTFTNSRWTSVAAGVAVVVTALGLLAALDRKTDLPAVLLGIAGGLVLYEVVRLSVVHSGWGPLQSPVARRVARTPGFRPETIESDTPGIPRTRP